MSYTNVMKCHNIYSESEGERVIDVHCRSPYLPCPTPTEFTSPGCQEGLKARLAVVAKRVLPRELLGVPGTSDGTAVEETEATRNEWLIYFIVMFMLFP